MIVAVDFQKGTSIQHTTTPSSPTEKQPIRVAHTSRYARSGSGYRFIPAGENLFERPREPLRAS